MSPSCPISHRRIDSNLVRLISFQVFLFALLFSVTNSVPVMLIVLFDFIARGVRKEKLSPFMWIAKMILEKWQVPPHYTNEAPKRFALYLGFAITILILLLTLSGFAKLGALLAIVLMICAFLEVLFDFCIGCKIYYGLQLLKVIKYDRNFN